MTKNQFFAINDGLNVLAVFGILHFSIWFFEAVYSPRKVIPDQTTTNFKVCPMGYINIAQNCSSKNQTKECFIKNKKGFAYSYDGGQSWSYCQ